MTATAPSAPLPRRTPVLRKYALYALPDGFTLPRGDAGFRTLCDEARVLLNRGGIRPCLHPMGDGCTLIAFTHAGKNDIPARAVNRGTGQPYTLYYPPRNSEIILIDEPHRLVYLSPYHPTYAGALAEIVLRLCAPTVDLIPAPLSLGLLRAFPREYQCPSADRLWTYIALLRVLLREYGRNPAEIRLAWGSDAFEKFRLGEYACRGDLLSAGLAINPLHSSRTYTLDFTNVGPAPRIRGTLTAANLPAVGDFISACLLDPAAASAG